MAVESLMVDLAAPWTVDSNEAMIDNLELVVYQARPEAPDWTKEGIADHETGKAADSLIESATGPPRMSKREWVKDSAFPGPLNLSVKLSVQYQRNPEAERLDELYDMTIDGMEARNLLKPSQAGTTDATDSEKLAKFRGQDYRLGAVRHGSKPALPEPPPRRERCWNRSVQSIIGWDPPPRSTHWNLRIESPATLYGLHRRCL
jgi:hypothetical protein